MVKCEEFFWKKIYNYNSENLPILENVEDSNINSFDSVFESESCEEEELKMYDMKSDNYNDNKLFFRSRSI